MRKKHKYQGVGNRKGIRRKEKPTKPKKVNSKAEDGISEGKKTPETEVKKSDVPKKVERESSGASCSGVKRWTIVKKVDTILGKNI